MHHKVSPDVDFRPNCYSSLNNLITTASREDQGILYIAVCAFAALNHKNTITTALNLRTSSKFTQPMTSKSPTQSQAFVSYFPQKCARFFRILEMFLEQK